MYTSSLLPYRIFFTFSSSFKRTIYPSHPSNNLDKKVAKFNSKERMDQKVGQQFPSFHLLKINLLFLTATRVRTDKGDKKFAKADSRCCRKSKETQEESDEGYTRGALFKSDPSFSPFLSPPPQHSPLSNSPFSTVQTSRSYRISAAYWKSIGSSWHRASLPLST